MSWEDYVDCDCCEDYVEKEEDEGLDEDENRLIDIALFNYECKVYNEKERMIWRQS